MTNADILNAIFSYKGFVCASRPLIIKKRDIPWFEKKFLPEASSNFETLFQENRIREENSKSTQLSVSD